MTLKVLKGVLCDITYCMSYCVLGPLCQENLEKSRESGRTTLTVGWSQYPCVDFQVSACGSNHKLSYWQLIYT